MRWQEEFEQVEQRIQQNLNKLRELNERMAEVIQNAHSRGTRTSKRTAKQ